MHSEDMVLREERLEACDHTWVKKASVSVT